MYIGAAASGKITQQIEKLAENKYLLLGVTGLFCLSTILLYCMELEPEWKWIQFISKWDAVPYVLSIYQYTNKIEVLNGSASATAYGCKSQQILQLADSANSFLTHLYL